MKIYLKTASHYGTEACDNKFDNYIKALKDQGLNIENFEVLNNNKYYIIDLISFEEIINIINCLGYGVVIKPLKNIETNIKYILTIYDDYIE